MSDRPLERVNLTKVLGVHLSEHLHRDEHVKQLSKSCHSILGILRKIKNFTDFKLRKYRVKSLVLCKMDYCDSVFYPLPDFLLRRLHRVQFAAASYVSGRHVKNRLAANEGKKRFLFT